MRFSHLLLGALACAAASPVLAQEDTAPPKPVTVSGSVAVLTDYRLRGISQTDKNAAVQGSLTIAHESGFYIGTFGSNLSGWGTFGGSNLELDAIGGYKHAFGGTTVDVGATWYTYPGGFSESDVVELFGRLGHTVGPASVTAGVYYAPKQTSLGNFSATRYSRGQREDNLYVTGDATVGVPGFPVTAKAHIGYSNGNPGLGPNGTSLAPTGEYLDWMVGADVAFYKNLTFGVQYIDTDIGTRESAYLQPNFSVGQDGTGRIAGPTVLFSISAGF